MTADPADLQTTIDEVTATDAGLTIEVSVENTTDRPLHYIAGVRALVFDDATATLTVRLTDEGRVVVPGAANVEPVMGIVDPNATASITVELPAEIVQLAPAPGGDPKRVAFARSRIADATTVRTEIAFSDDPYYEDTRAREEAILPAMLWQQHLATASFEVGDDG